MDCTKIIVAHSVDISMLYIKIKNVSLTVIPQGTVDNNLGPDRLAGPKAIDPNYFRQLTNTLIARPLY